ncbi:MAG: hypothetical protein ACKVZH_06795 [Blastocatellia bacterium]
MATRKRRTARPAARRKTTSTASRKRRNPSTTFGSRRRAVATRSRRRSVARRRNPSTGGLFAQAAGLAAGITAVGLLGSFVPPIGGASPFAVAGRQAATGWLIGEGMQRFNIMRNYANDLKLAGLALGVGTLINAFILPTVSGIFRPASRQQASDSNGVGDLVTLPAGNYDPYYGSTPKIGGVPVRANKAAQLKDLLAMPAMPGAYQRFGR